MIVLTGPFADWDESGPSATAVGVFDGVHRGHQAVLELVVDQARAAGLAPTVMTFDPHPLVLVAPDRAPRRLTTIEQRIDRLEGMGVEVVAVLRFTEAVRDMAPDAFISDLLVGKLDSRLVVAGIDFRFGAGRAGDVALLERHGDESGFEVVASPLLGSGQPVSSTRIREHLLAGDVGEAGELLGRPYELAVSGIGTERHGSLFLGRFEPDPEVVVPAAGAYRGRVEDESIGLIVEGGGVSAVSAGPLSDGSPVFIERVGGSELDPAIVLERAIQD